MDPWLLQALRSEKKSWVSSAHISPHFHSHIVCSQPSYTPCLYTDHLHHPANNLPCIQTIPVAHTTLPPGTESSSCPMMDPLGKLTLPTAQ